MIDALYSGAAAGLCSCLVLQPLDLIKTRLQEQPHRTDFNRLLLFTRQIYITDGLRGFLAWLDTHSHQKCSWDSPLFHDLE